VADVVVIPPGGGEVIGDSPERRVEILADGDDLNATWSRFGPRREGADLHVHRQHTDLFYVLAGELTVRLGVEDEQVAVPAGTLARVPPNVVHGFRNASDAELRYLNFHAPGCRFADYLRAVRDGRELSYDQYPPPGDGGRPPSEAVVGGAELVADEPGLRVLLLAEVDAIAIRETRAEPGRTLDAEADYVYVLEGEVALASESEKPGTVICLSPAFGAGTWARVGGSARFAAGDAPARVLGVRTRRYPDR
jgi:mannose-6-phosphate isomerase-like protein (cupin superfamily)